MIMSKQVEFSDRQELSKTAITVSTNALDLGEYFIRSGYPAAQGTVTDGVVGDPRLPGQRNDTSYSLDGSNRQGATKERVEVGRGYYQINRRFGTKDFPFLCQVTEDIVGSNVLTGLKVEFRTHTADPGQTADLGKLEAAAFIPVTTEASAGNRIAKGTQIGWPFLPKYLTNRYFFLQYVAVVADQAEDVSDLTAGRISAAIVLSMPSF